MGVKQVSAHLHIILEIIKGGIKIISHTVFPFSVAEHALFRLFHCGGNPGLCKSLFVRLWIRENLIREGRMFCWTLETVAGESLEQESPPAPGCEAHTPGMK